MGHGGDEGDEKDKLQQFFPLVLLSFSNAQCPMPKI